MSEQIIKPRALKAGKAAEYIGVSRRYLHDLTQQGRIKHVRVGTRCFLYLIEELDRFLDENLV